MRNAVFIDSGAFIAFLDASDDLHLDAVALFAAPPAGLFTSILVVSETYGWFLHRLGEEAARRFRALVVRLPRLKILGADARHHAAVLKKLETLRGHKLTYVDASSLVLLREKGSISSGAPTTTWHWKARPYGPAAVRAETRTFMLWPQMGPTPARVRSPKIWAVPSARGGAPRLQR